MNSSNERGRIGGIPTGAVLFGSIVLLGILLLGWNAIQGGNPWATSSGLSVTGNSTRLSVVSEANVRDRPTAQGSNIVGKLMPGEVVDGIVQNGEVPGNFWLRLSNGNGYVSLVNLSDRASGGAINSTD